MSRLKKEYTREELQELLKTKEGRKEFIEFTVREEGKLKSWSTKQWIKEAKKFKRQCKDFIEKGELSNLKK